MPPRFRLSPSDQGSVAGRAVEGPSELTHIKEERVIIKTRLCSGRSTEEPISTPTWNTNSHPLQTQPGVAGVPESEEGSGVSVKTEERRTWTPPLHHTQTAPLASPGGALLQHTQTEEDVLPQDVWTEESLQLNQPVPGPVAPQPQAVQCPGPSAAVTPLYPPGGALPQASRNQKPQKRFHCTLCPKAFASNFHLVSHMRVHTGERPFECPVCEKSFRVKGNLDQHMMIHYDLRPFSCTFCGKAFSQKSNLNNHLWVHTGVKPFSCSVCGKQYRQRSSLSLHMASHS